MTPATSPARSCKVAPSREPQLLPTPRILIEIVWNPPVTSARARRSKYPVLQPAFASNTTGAPKPQSVHSSVASPTSMVRCCCILTSAPARLRQVSAYVAPIVSCVRQVQQIDHVERVLVGFQV